MALIVSRPTCNHFGVGTKDLASALGAAHQDTLRTMGNLAIVLQHQGDLAAARAMYERTLEGKESALGAAHPDTLLTMMNLAGVLAKQGDLAAARAKAYEAVERIRFQDAYYRTDIGLAELEALH